MDYFIGDNDGIVTKWGLHDKIFWIHIWGVAISLTIWAWLSKNFLLANLSATVWLWILVEIIFSFLVPSASSPFNSTGNYGEIFKKDSLIGYQLTPLGEGTATKVTLANDTVYDVTYHIDAHSRRLTPNNHDSLSNYALFFGGSFTFGEGLHGHETMPSLFTKYTQQYNSYNYGMSGCGPHQMYAFFENNLVQPTIKEKNGSCFYIYIADHINRMNGTVNNMFSFGETHPRYVLEEGEMVRKGSHKSGHPAIFRYFFELASKSNILLYFGMLNKPITLGDPIENTAKLIGAAKKLHQKQFGNDNFYVVIYPSEDTAIIPYLEKEKITVIDLSHLFGPLDYRLHPRDLHPTKEGNELMIKELVERLKTQ